MGLVSLITSESALIMRSAGPRLILDGIHGISEPDSSFPHISSSPQDSADREFTTPLTLLDALDCFRRSLPTTTW